MAAPDVHHRPDPSEEIRVVGGDLGRRDPRVGLHGIGERLVLVPVARVGPRVLAVDVGALARAQDVLGDAGERRRRGGVQHHEGRHVARGEEAGEGVLGVVVVGGLAEDAVVDEEPHDTAEVVGGDAHGGGEGGEGDGAAVVGDDVLNLELDRRLHHRVGDVTEGEFPDIGFSLLGFVHHHFCAFAFPYSVE